MKAKPLSFKPVNRLQVRISLEGEMRTVGTLAWNQTERRSYFEFDRTFLDAPLPLSPFRLPTNEYAKAAPYDPFDGLHGLFNDSLPDGWGRLLVDRRLRKYGVDSRTITPLDRLTIVGSRGMGALTFVPEHLFPDGAPEALDLDWISKHSGLIQNEAKTADVDLLQEIQGSSTGARPKIVVGMDAVNNRVVADFGEGLPPGFEPWIVKFKSKHDIEEIGPMEYAYSLMARASGIEMAETRLIETTRGNRYFASRRFDRSERGRYHIHTASGLLQVDHRSPRIDYDVLLKLTRALTRDERDVRRMFGRMTFNVLAKNKDDHSKNHAFLMNADGSWQPTPAYDLTLSEGPGGEHSLAVAGEGRNPSLQDILKVAANASIPVAEAQSIIDRVQSAINEWPHHASEAGMSSRKIKEIDLLLNGPRPSPRKRITPGPDSLPQAPQPRRSPSS